MILTFVFGAGDPDLDDCAEAAFDMALLGGDKESEINGPAAEGGAFDVIALAVGAASSVIKGFWLASGGLSRNAKFPATVSLCFCRDEDVGI